MGEADGNDDRRRNTGKRRQPSRGGPRSRPRGDAREPHRAAYAFTLPVAHELLALLTDDDGEADEDLLDEAHDALDHPLEPRDATRDQLLLWMSDRERDEVRTLIDEGSYRGAPRADDKVVRHVAHHLSKRLDQRRDRP